LKKVVPERLLTIRWYLKRAHTAGPEDAPLANRCWIGIDMRNTTMMTNPGTWARLAVDWRHPTVGRIVILQSRIREAGGAPTLSTAVRKIQTSLGDYATSFSTRSR